MGHILRDRSKLLSPTSQGTTDFDAKDAKGAREPLRLYKDNVSVHAYVRVSMHDL